MDTHAKDGRGFGFHRQSQVFRAGAYGHRPAVPTDPQTLQEQARRASSRRAWAYVHGAAGTATTMRRNRAAFSGWTTTARVAHGVLTRSLGVELLGRRLPAPVLLAPIGAGDLMRSRSDLLVARACADTGVPLVVSNQSCHPMEQIARNLGDTPWWFQLYLSRDDALVDSFIHRAEAAGAGALVVTLDTAMLGWRTADLNLGSLPFARGEGIAQYTSDPRFQRLVEERMAAGSALSEPPSVTPAAVATLLAVLRNHPGPFWANLRNARHALAAVETFLDVYTNPAVSWEHLARLRERTSLPMILKGITHPQDARRALQIGADAIVVSNHGGRQLDHGPAALDLLPAVRAAVGPAACVLFDSGIRSGADVFLALALGADAVLLGRPYVYGLAVAGHQGVREVTENVVAELDLMMGLLGLTSCEQITADLVESAPVLGATQP